MERPLALIVDADAASRETIRRVLETHEVAVRDATTSEEAAEALRSLPIHLLVVDVQTPGINVEQLLVRARRMQPAPQVIPLAAGREGARARALEVAGAFDVLDRPLDERRLHATVRAALQCQALLDETRALRIELQRREGYDGLVGRSREMERLRERVGRLAGTDAPVWFCGESGTGKEHAAREIHGLSGRAARRFEVLPCGGAEGVRAGARLGLPATDGALLAALRGGTLYLEELPALPRETQLMLLAALDRPLDVRFLASSTGDPRDLVERGSLIEPLAARLAAETVTLPALRERPEDVPLLARHFVRTICAINRLPPIQLHGDALRLLEAHRWPDNVRGLRNALEQAVIVCPDGTIRARDLPRELRPADVGAPSERRQSAERAFRDAKREVVEAFEREYLDGLMGVHAGNVTAAAQQAGMLRSALQRLLRKYGLKSADFRPAQDIGRVADLERPGR
jgi:DNA-binding NtrC family response regulator